MPRNDGVERCPYLALRNCFYIKVALKGDRRGSKQWQQGSSY